MKLLSFFLSLFLLFLISCSNKNRDKDPFSDILTSPPFAGLTDSIRDSPDNHDLYFKRAVLLNKNNYPEPAILDFEKAWALNKNEKYAFGLANLLLEKKPDSAIRFLNEAISKLPNSFLLQITLGRSLIARKQYDEALKITDQLLQKNPQQVDVLKMKADILDSKGEKSRAISELEKAYQLTPGDVELNYMLALRLAESGNARVLFLCDSLIKADSLGIHAEPYYYKGIYFSAINEKQKAFSFFDQAIKKDYYFLDGYIEKGALLYEMKKYPDALGVFNLCLTISPKFADAYYWIARTQEAMGKKEEAVVNYERAYSLDNTLVEAKDAANRLRP